MIPGFEVPPYDIEQRSGAVDQLSPSMPETGHIVTD